MMIWPLFKQSIVRLGPVTAAFLLSATAVGASDRPDTVQIISGCQGTAQLTSTPKSYQVSATQVSSGLWLDTAGTILTQHSALASARNFNICDELLFRDLVSQVAREQGWDPTDIRRNHKRIEAIGQHSQLRDRQPIQLVMLPDGTQRSFTVTLMSPLKSEGIGMAMIKINPAPIPAATARQ
jgi:hypothetical protein